MSKIFSWFYISINFGAFTSSLLTPILLDKYGPSIAFGVPGALMLVATWAFWLGRGRFVHVPAAGKSFAKETFKKENVPILLKLLVVYCFVAIFWALFDQTASAWVLQAENMDRMFLGFTWLPSQIQAVNPILILALTPVVSLAVYPLLSKMMNLTSLKKISIGFFIAVSAFLLSAQIESWITAGYTPSIGWQLVAYLLITVAEIFVSITCLEFSYTQAPKSIKSLVMAFYLLSVSLGNLFVMAVNFFIQNDDGTVMLKGADYYLFFAGAMGVAAVLFIGVVKWYGSEKQYEEGPSSEPNGNEVMA